MTEYFKVIFPGHWFISESLNVEMQSQSSMTKVMLTYTDKYSIYLICHSSIMFILYHICQDYILITIQMQPWWRNVKRNQHISIKNLSVSYYIIISIGISKRISMIILRKYVLLLLIWFQSITLHCQKE